MTISIFHRKKIKLKSEEELINFAKKDSRYFTPIYEKYHDPIFRFIYQRMDSDDDASDLTSQVFLKALLNLSKYEFKGFPFSSWLYRIALNEVNQFYRQTKNKRTINIDEINLKVVVEETGEAYDQIKREKLLSSLSNLNEDKLTLIEMRFFEKRAFKEIATILNISENNAKVRTYRVLDEMKKNML